MIRCLKDFSKITYLHGVKEIFHSPSRVERCLWLITGSVALTFLCYQLGTTLADFVRNPIRHKSGLIFPVDYEYPNALYCMGGNDLFSKEMMTATKLSQDKARILSNAFLFPRSIDHVKLESGENGSRSDSLSLGGGYDSKNVSQLILRFSRNVTIECDPNCTTSKVITSHGVCYHIRPGEKRERNYGMALSTAVHPRYLRMRVTAPGSPHPTPPDDMKYPFLTLGERGYLQARQEMSLVPGYNFHVYYQTIKHKIKSSPFKECGTQSYQDILSCIVDCLNNRYCSKVTTCRLMSTTSGGNVSATCNYEAPGDHCFIRLKAGVPDALKDCNAMCPCNCEEDAYSVTLVPVASTSGVTDVIFLPQSSFEITYTEGPEYNFGSLMATCGGLISLLSGASILALIQCIYHPIFYKAK